MSLARQSTALLAAARIPHSATCCDQLTALATCRLPAPHKSQALVAIELTSALPGHPLDSRWAMMFALSLGDEGQLPACASLLLQKMTGFIMRFALYFSSLCFEA